MSTPFAIASATDQALTEFLPTLRQLGSVYLILPENHLSADGLRQLRGCGFIQGMSLDRSAFPEEFWQTLGELHWLEELSLDTCNLASGQFGFLKKLPRLRRLDVSDTGFCDADMDALPVSLRDLNVEGTKVSKACLSQIGRFRELRFLRLARTGIGPLDCFILGQYKQLQVCFQ